jgi:L-rhamnose isomerase/sugar isomerase
VPVVVGTEAGLTVLDSIPIAAYHRSGYQEKIVAERADGQQAGWGA